MLVDVLVDVLVEVLVDVLVDVLVEVLVEVLVDRGADKTFTIPRLEAAPVVRLMLYRVEPEMA